jgi:hypothetical protein
LGVSVSKAGMMVAGHGQVLVHGPPRFAHAAAAEGPVDPRMGPVAHRQQRRIRHGRGGVGGARLAASRRRRTTS